MKFLTPLIVLFAGILFLQSCSKEYSLEGGMSTLPAGNWEFKDSTTEFSGVIDTAFITGTSGNKELHLSGKSASGKEIFSVTLFGDEIKPGTYKTSLFQATLNYSGTGMIYQANQSTGELIVVISTINTNLVTGTFSGKALDSSNVVRQLFDGKFKATFSGPGSGPVSSGVLGDSSGNCKPAVVAGIYQQGVVMSAANTVQLQATVTQPGSYNITSNAVNGVTFSGSGTFTSAGIQTVSLTASGTPAFPGNQTFNVAYGNSQCAFTINFLPVTAADYYPLTVNNSWTYGNINGVASDSFHLKVISNAKAINGMTYSDIAQYDVPPSVAYDSLYLRKSNGNYYQYLDFSDYFFFDQTTYAETIILKDNVAAGSTWTSPTVTGEIQGVPVQGSLKFTILEKAVPVSLGIYNLPDVIKVKMETIVAGASIGSAEFWYAKNVGLVYVLENGTAGYQIGRWLNF